MNLKKQILKTVSIFSLFYFRLKRIKNPPFNIGFTATEANFTTFRDCLKRLFPVILHHMSKGEESDLQLCYCVDFLNIDSISTHVQDKTF